MFEKNNLNVNKSLLNNEMIKGNKVVNNTEKEVEIAAENINTSARKRMSWYTILVTCLLFMVAGLFEIGGGWCVWQYFREKKHISWCISGFVILALYGVVPTFQPEEAGPFYRVICSWEILT